MRGEIGGDDQGSEGGDGGDIKGGREIALLTKPQPHIHHQFMSVWYNKTNKKRTAR